MDKDHAWKGAWLGIDLTSEANGDEGSAAGNLDEADYHVLPLFPDGDVAAAMTRLMPGDLDLCVRHKLVAIALLPLCTVYAAASEAALLAGRKMGYCVAARINPAAYQQAFDAVLAPGLLQMAVDHLAGNHPLLSAHQRLTRQQSVVAALLALAGVTISKLVDGVSIWSVVALAAGLFFSMTVILRTMSLLPRAARARAKPIPLTPAGLPVYSVLVPLFRETSVLPKLINGLMALDYPVLCIKRTKRLP